MELAPEVGDTWFNIATIYASQGQWPQATEAFLKARELAGRNRKTGAVYLDSGVALGRIAFVHQNDPAAAEAYLREVLSIRPDYVPALITLGVMYERLARVSDAFEAYHAAIEVDPNNFDARYNLGNILMTLGNYREAAEQFAVAVGNNPTSAEAWTNFGWAQLQLGGRNGAINAFRRALAINPNLEQARKGLEKANKP